MLNAHVLCTTAWDVLLADSAASVTGATRLAASRAGAAWHLRLGAAAAGAPPRRHFSSDGMNERHVQLLGLRMDALKQNKLSEDDLQAAFDSTVDSVGHDSHYFRALEALSALKLVLRHQTLGATAAAKGTSQWPAFHPEELAHLGSAERPAPQMEDSVGIASAAAATPVHAGDRIRVVRGSYQNKFATVVRPTAARYIVRLDRGGEVCLAPSSLMVQQAVNARTLAATEGRPVGLVAAPIDKPAPADWAASAGVAGIAAPVLASAASELAELHAWLGRDSAAAQEEKDWDPVAV
jgi:hypothetical protein